tara:strand:+ start:688 stop:1563 length:876 start_codon:yes stop_codon:yes gene_type:complete
MKEIRLIFLLMLIGLNLSCKTLTTNTISSSDSADEKKGTREQINEIVILQQDADRAYAENNWQKAIDLYRKFLNLVPDNPAWFKLANAYSRINLNENAINAYKQALQLDQKNIKAWHNLAIIQLRLAKNNFINLQKNTDPNDSIGIKARELENEINRLLNNDFDSSSATKEARFKVVKEMTVEEYIKDNKNKVNEIDLDNANLPVEYSEEISTHDSGEIEKEIDNALVVSVNLANIRFEPTTDSKSIMVLAKDTIVIEINRQKDWVNIRLSNAKQKNGWIHESLVRKKDDN